MSSSFFRRVFVTVARSFLAWYNNRQARSITTASTDKNPDSKTPSDIFYVGLLTGARRGLIWGLVRRRAGEEQFDYRLAYIRAARSDLGLFQ